MYIGLEEISKYIADESQPANCQRKKLQIKKGEG